MECVPLDAKRKAEKKKTKILKLMLPFVGVLINNSENEIGKAVKYSLIISVGIENLDAIAPIKAIKGMIDKTKKKASWPGSTLISGFVTNAITFLKNLVTRSIFSSSLLLHFFFGSYHF